MTESDWNKCPDPHAMLAWLRRSDKGSERKLRLVAAGWCWLNCSWLQGSEPWTGAWAERAKRCEGDCRATLNVGERFADGLALDSERAAAYAAVRGWAEAWGSYDLGLYYAALSAAVVVTAPGSLETSLFPPGPYANDQAGMAAQAADRARQAALLRCLFGPLPFRAVPCDPAWRTETALALATAVYAERAFDRLPVLGDALQDAGCADADILNHCRETGVHAKGCWVVDLILGKS